jgi:hypothetical protein
MMPFIAQAAVGEFLGPAVRDRGPLRERSIVPATARPVPMRGCV